ncbi:hypothetical protein BGX28_001669 [Mortierella sp. GBA30]|nr:hypothetical protein BGX28_001669 [Mortierella sp. GBA30]
MVALEHVRAPALAPVPPFLVSVLVPATSSAASLEVKAAAPTMVALEHAKAPALAPVLPFLVSVLVPATSSAASLEAALEAKAAAPTMVALERARAPALAPVPPFLASVPAPATFNVASLAALLNPRLDLLMLTRLLPLHVSVLGFPTLGKGGGHGSRPGPSYGTCEGYTGSIQPCPATSTFGFDCSGFVRDALYQGTGIDLGHGGNTDSQLADGHATVIDYSQRQPGDIEFFGPRGNTHHVILYIGKDSAGQDRMIEAQQTGTNVHEVPLRTGGIWARVR